MTHVRVRLAEDHPINRQPARAQLKALGVVHVPVAFDGEPGLAAGMSDFLPKPVSMQAMQAAFTRFLSTR